MHRHAAADDPGEDVVGRNAESVVTPKQGAAPSVFRQRQQKRHLPDEVWGKPRGKQAAFAQRFVDQAHLKVLEVAQPAVDQLGRLRGGAGAEVAGFDERDRQTPGGRVHRCTGTGHAAADDQHVELFPAQASEILRAPLRGEARGREPGHGRVAHRSTVPADVETSSPPWAPRAGRWGGRAALR